MGSRVSLGGLEWVSEDTVGAGGSGGSPPLRLIDEGLMENFGTPVGGGMEFADLLGEKEGRGGVPERVVGALVLVGVGGCMARREGAEEEEEICGGRGDPPLEGVLWWVL